MEKLGRSFKDLMNHRRLIISIVDILNLGIELLNIVERLHDDLGVCHLDIKPDNTMIG